MSNRENNQETLSHRTIRAFAVVGELKQATKPNPFAAGRVGGYNLRPMAASEYTRAINESGQRLGEAGPQLGRATHEYRGKKLDFAYSLADGDPFEVFVQWADAGVPAEDVCDFQRKLEDPSFRGADVWWAANADVLWAFDDGDTNHLALLLESMKTTER